MSNWPGGVDRSGSNWSGRTQRTESWGGAWDDSKRKVPTAAWIAAAAFVWALFFALPAIGSAAGM